MERMKYIRLRRGSIVIFPCIVEHSTFENLEPVSAGFCDITNDEIVCFGESVSLRMKSRPDDSLEATKQYCGMEAYLKIKHYENPPI